MPKPFWQSKTLWVNGLILLGLLLQQTGITQLPVPPEVQAWLPGLLAALNIGLRLVTKQPLILTTPSEPSLPPPTAPA